VKLDERYWSKPRDLSVQGVRRLMRGSVGEPSTADRKAIDRFVRLAINRETPDPEAIHAAGSLLLEATSMLHYGHDLKPAFTARGYRKLSDRRDFRPDLAGVTRGSYGGWAWFAVLELEAGALTNKQCKRILRDHDPCRDERDKNPDTGGLDDRTLAKWIKAIRPYARQQVDTWVAMPEPEFEQFFAGLLREGIIDLALALKNKRG
jgi:hypothetical protein